MHDGRFATLEDVVGFYASGIRAHPGLDPVFGGRIGGDWHHPATQPSAPPGGPSLIVSPEPDPGLALDRRQRADLVAFLKTLTDRALLDDPRFADPFPRRRP
jgi:cytochrome c peroxidase